LIGPTRLELEDRSTTESIMGVWPGLFKRSNEPPEVAPNPKRPKKLKNDGFEERAEL
jgi:hypothetical protein